MQLDRSHASLAPASHDPKPAGEHEVTPPSSTAGGKGVESPLTASESEPATPDLAPETPAKEAEQPVASAAEPTTDAKPTSESESKSLVDKVKDIVPGQHSQAALASEE